MSNALVIIIPGEPHAQGRARFRAWRAKDGRSGVMAYDPAESRNWKAAAQEHMRRAFCEHYGTTAQRTPFIPQGAVELRVVATFTCPKTDHRKRDPRPRRPHTKKPDADNVLKAVKDAAKGVLWLDDSQVARVTVEKWIGAQGEAPRVEVVVCALDYPARGEVVARSALFLENN